MFFRKPQEVFYLNSQRSLISYRVPSMFALLYFFCPMPPTPSLGRKGPLPTPSGPCLACCHPPSHRASGGLRRVGCPRCLWWMELKAFKFLAIFVILVVFPVSQICAALMCYRLKGKKKKVVSVSTHSFISYSCVLPPRAQSWVRPGISGTEEGAGLEEKS